MSAVSDLVVGPLVWPVLVQREFLAHLDIETGDYVLDVGCDTGTTAVFAAEHGATVTARGQSRSHLTRATTKAADTWFGHGDAEQLPYADAPFETMGSVGSIRYWPHPEQVRAELFRVTTPGARVAILGFHDLPVSPSNLLASAMAAPTRALYFCYDSREAHRLFRAAGWTAIECNRTGPAWPPQVGTV